MPSFDVSVQVLDGLDGPVSVDWLTQVAERAMAAGRADSDAGVSVMVADDAVVRDLNRRHRGLDENTDVLSFSFTHEGEYYGERAEGPPADDGLDFVLPPGEDSSLGEVIISYHQARRQAAGSGHSVERELALLLTHGVLHLLGYDHVEPEDEAAMKGAEAKVLSGVFEGA